MKRVKMDAPIILIGTMRSGTTWLGGAFARDPRLAYWSEPRHVWTRGFARKPDDMLTAEDASPAVAARIRRTFDRFVNRRGRDRLAEKTPSNCLRVPFVHAVFPEAKILLILRDGRSVLESTARIIRSGIPVWRIAKRAMETPVAEWPTYAPRAVDMIARRVTRRPVEYWGVRPPGWREWVGRDPMHVMFARQWVGAVERATMDADALPEGACLTFRYEDLVREPARLAGQIAEHCALRDPGLFVSRVVETADASRIDRWRQTLDECVLEEVRPIMEPTLRRIGYEW